MAIRVKRIAPIMDKYKLYRFILAQDNIYAYALKELQEE